MLKVTARPALRSPALLCGFSGWADAASAASGALRYLLVKRPGRSIAEFDPDQIYVYTTTRPLSLFDELGRRRLQWPELTFTAVEVPEASRDLVILLGSEPDLRWRECITAIGDFILELGVSQVITFGAFLAQLHYAGAPVIQGLTNDPKLQHRLNELGIRQSSYQGPTSFVTAILRKAFELRIPSFSLWAAAPSYLSNTSNPKLAAALLRQAEKLLGQDLWVQELEVAGRDMERRIADALRERPDLANFLRQLSGESPTLESQPSTAEESTETELPSAEEVLQDLEEYLRRLKEGPSEKTGNGES
ncbi:MAG: PAC2 family protein [Chloroflexota bacterium]|jgi:proteasome assembly chaperone (PAC2) family protein